MRGPVIGVGASGFWTLSMRPPFYKYKGGILMDTGKGEFRMLNKEEVKKFVEEHPLRTDIFHVGDEVNIRDSRFRIVKITPKKMTLRILPRD